MPVAATGSGKTVVLSKVMTDTPGRSIAIAHRQELVSQISLALARNGVRHGIAGNNAALIRVINALQVSELGYSLFDPSARATVAGVDTLIKVPENDPIFVMNETFVIDEGHHVLRKNKWGKCALRFTRGRGLIPTATPIRADGKGLGRHADGIIDRMVQAPTMRQIINMGYLTDYRIYAPPSAFRRENIDVSESTGDFKPDSARKEIKRAQITGDVVGHYLKLARGKLGVTFAVDVEAATEIASAYRAAGVPAEVVSAKTPDALRAAIIRRFKNREILQLVNVDLFGEGFDLPAIEVVSFARPTESFALYSQQFGRALRLMLSATWAAQWNSLTDAQRLAAIAGSEKPFAIIIDHVGNVVRHGLPDARREWSLDRRERRGGKKSDAIPVRTCASWVEETGKQHTGCGLTFERVFKECPYCKCPVTPPAVRSGPEHVDGDLLELDPAVLAQMRGEIARIDGDFHAPHGLSDIAKAGARKQHWNRQQAQSELRNLIAWWAGLEHAQGRRESESYRRFYFQFGTDVATAQTLGTREAGDLAQRVRAELQRHNINPDLSATAHFAREAA